MRRSFTALVGRRRRSFTRLCATPRTRYCFAELCAAAPRLRRRRMSELVDLSPRFQPAEYAGSVYYLWAARFFVDNQWQGLPQDEVDDLLQGAYFKYRRCVELYVYGKRTCRGPKHLMCLFQRACRNMLIDGARKKRRHPEKYYAEDTRDHNEVLDTTMIAVIEASAIRGGRLCPFEQYEK